MSARGPSDRAPAAASEREIVVSGSLASSRRTVTGVLGQLALAGLSQDEIRGIFGMAGLPGRAMDDPDFPISLEQELLALSSMLEHLRRSERSCARWAIERFSWIGINHYGVLGLAMQHAATVLEALRVFLAYPELSWGHSRIAVARTRGAVVLSFEMDAYGADAVGRGALREYCVTRDLVSVERLLGDILARRIAPATIALPAAAPTDDFDAWGSLPCPVRFHASAVEIRYPAEILDAVPVHAGALPFRRYEKIARGFSRMLADDASVTEQATRLLWAYTPPPHREELAAMLTMSPRTLARRLRAEGTSYHALLRKVHAERASNFLLHSTLSIAEIADRMGYSDPAAFTRAFRAWTGMAPSRWRHVARTHRGRPTSR